MAIRGLDHWLTTPPEDEWIDFTEEFKALVVAMGSESLVQVEVAGMDDKELHCKFSGYRHITPPDSEDEEVQDLATEIVCGEDCQGEHDGHGWDMYLGREDDGSRELFLPLTNEEGLDSCTEEMKQAVIKRLYTAMMAPVKVFHARMDRLQEAVRTAGCPVPFEP